MTPANFPLFQLVMADGVRWHLHAPEEDAGRLLSNFAGLTGLDSPSPPPRTPPEPGETRKAVIRVGIRNLRWRHFPFEKNGEIQCYLGPVSTPRKMGIQILRLARIPAYTCELQGGLLVHGALVEKNGLGVILAGPGGAGKTTAAGRIPHPWRMLSDDLSLIARSPQGEYWAHPWPTFSRLRLGDLSGRWDVREAVRLGMVCMLSQHPRDRLHRLSFTHAVGELVEAAGQTRVFMTAEMDEPVARQVNLKRFHNAAAMAGALPVYRLQISLTGQFWRTIEEEWETPQSGKIGTTGEPTGCMGIG